MKLEIANLIELYKFAHNALKGRGISNGLKD
jgi:hypothetical protein